MPSFISNQESSSNENQFKTTQWKPFMMVTLLFLLWAVIVNANEVLMPHLKKALNLSDFESSLIPSAFFMAYFTMALPAGLIMQRFGYKKGILFGLMLCMVGATLFYPAADMQSFQLFLVAQFILASGSATLETAANPYATLLGPKESASFRLNFAQSFNSFGAVMTPLLGASLLLSGITKAENTFGQVTAENETQFRTLIADAVKTPYLFLALIFLLVAVLIFFTKLPEARQKSETEKSPSASSLFKYPHAYLGVVALFLYVGAQVSVTSFMVRFSMFSIQSLSEETASSVYLFSHLVLFMVGRFVGSALLKVVTSGVLLAGFGVGATILGLLAMFTEGNMALYAVVGIGFFHSIMFPTIFYLALKDLGPMTKMVSSFLVMSIVGGAVATPLMGFASDVLGLQMAYIVPVLCYIYIIFYGLKGSQLRTS